MGAPIELPRPFLYCYFVGEITYKLHLQGLPQHSLTPTCESPIVTPVSGLPCQYWSAQLLATVLPTACMIYREELVQIFKPAFDSAGNLSLLGFHQLKHKLLEQRILASFDDILQSVSVLDCPDCNAICQSNSNSLRHRHYKISVTHWSDMCCVAAG
jgi:hypothetical protein